MIVGMPNTFGDPVLWLQELMKENIYPYKDAKQIITGALRNLLQSSDLIHAVDSGILDLAFVRSTTAYISGAKYTELKTIGARNVSIPGTQSLYPLPISTGLYPETGIAAIPPIPGAVRLAVSSALLRLDAASPPAALGGYVRWDAPAAYDPVSHAAEDAGLFRVDPQTRGRWCRSLAPGFRDNDMVVCPAPYLKVPEAVAEDSCRAANLSCVAGHACWCAPCRLAPLYEVAAAVDADGGRAAAAAAAPCAKMRVCAPRRRRRGRRRGRWRTTRSRKG